jgi:GH25 family lysozyme M1 (1,4-beta-N-acetylmuramidase)
MTKRGIDLSKHNGNVDFSKVKASGKVDYVILRAGLGKLASQKDAKFETYYRDAKAAGFPVGAYWFSYAMSEEEARQEADAFLEVIKGKQFEYPVYYDVELDKQFALGKEKVSKIIRAFLERVESKNYWVGLYGSYSSLTTYTAMDIRERYAIWLAHWGVKKSPYPTQYGMWQYGVGRIPGIVGDVDVDECYEDYPTAIKNAGDNGFEREEAPVSEPIVEPVNSDENYPVPTRVLKEGLSGDDVKWLQKELSERGYYSGKIDGSFGILTLGAVLAFQMKNGLAVDGICGPATRGKLC